MMSSYINRQGVRSGPYDLITLKTYVEDGQILLSDSAEYNSRSLTVRELLKQNNIKVKVKSFGTIKEQLNKLGRPLIIPSLAFIKNDLFKDKTLLLLVFVGLIPAFLIKFTLSSLLTFYAIAIYFAIIWGLFFFILFKTSQVKNRTALAVFFLSQLSTVLITQLQALPPFNFLYLLIDSSNIFSRFIGYFLGVGVLEEFTKLLPLIYIIRKSKEPVVPQTLVFYGLLSGLGFGAIEGVQYQTTVNMELDYNSSFFMNIARLTTLPFLHSIWCSIAGYFYSLSHLFPKFRRSLLLLCIGIPALLHGLYNTFGWTLPGLMVMILSVCLLIFYLKKANNFKSSILAT